MQAYQETHEDVRALYFNFLQPNLSLSIGCDRSVSYLQLQVAIVNILQFSVVDRGAEMFSLLVQLRLILLS